MVSLICARRRLFFPPIKNNTCLFWVAWVSHLALCWYSPARKSNGFIKHLQLLKQVILGSFIFVSTAEETCLTRLEKINCTDNEKSELHYICESSKDETCSCFFENPILTDVGFLKTCHSKSPRNLKKKKVRKRQIPDQNLCGTIDPPRPGKVSCYVSRADIECTGTCDYDHEFVDGMKEKTYMCLYADGIWQPAAHFPPCKPICNPACENGGTCESVDFCACSNDYRGNVCQYPVNLCAISKNKVPSSWRCNHTRSETTCDISCHAPDTPDAGLDVARYECSVDGIWNPQLPACVQAPACKEPATIKNGHWRLLIGNTLNIGTRIVYYCDDGYILLGEKILECTRNGSWTDEAPSCIPQQVMVCEDPGETTFGRRNISSAGFFEGSSISYECVENFTLLGSAVITCMGNGQWSSKKPQCMPTHHAPAFCSKPNAPKNSLVHVTFPYQHPLATVFNRDIPVSQWLYIINYARGPEKDFASLPDGTFVVGTRVQYKCKSRFYKLYGSEYQTCQASRIWSGYQPACIPECGRSDSPKTPFIVNGNSSRIGQWPWQVGLALKTGTGLHLLCGAVLVSELWVLTAAHCVAKKLTNIPVDPRSLLIFCGKYYRSFNRDDEYVQVKQVRRIIIHDDYDFIHFDGDIALLELESAVELSTRVQPVCLPSEDTTRENVRDGNKGIATGWGITENGKFSETLKEAILPVVSHDRCEEAYRAGLRTVTITRNMFCAGYESGHSDTCNGDSGGPLVFAVGQANNIHWYLEGIVSWGSESGCGKSHHYSGFTKVSRFVPWIKMYI